MTFMKFLAAAGLMAGNNCLCRVGSSSFPPSAGRESKTATGTSSQGSVVEHVQTKLKARGRGKVFLCKTVHFEGMVHSQLSCIQCQSLCCSSTESRARERPKSNVDRKWRHLIYLLNPILISSACANGSDASS